MKIIQFFLRLNDLVTQFRESKQQPFTLHHQIAPRMLIKTFADCIPLKPLANKSMLCVNNIYVAMHSVVQSAQIITIWSENRSHLIPHSVDGN